jgi:hypothetical protein
VSTVHNDFFLDSQADLCLQEHLLQTPGRFNDQSEAVGFSEGEKSAKVCVHNGILDSQADLGIQEHLLQNPNHLHNQSEAVVFSEGEKPAKVCVFTMMFS